MAHEFEDDADVVTETKPDDKVKRPRLFRVLLHNDDYTTREFVVFVLERVFRLSEGDAVRVMMHVHNNGQGVAGVYTREVAETKVTTVERLANENDYPLMLSLEPEEDDD